MIRAGTAVIAMNYIGLAYIITVASAAPSCCPEGSNIPWSDTKQLKTKATEFLLKHLPAMDADLPMSYIKKNVDLAIMAYKTNKWSRAVPWKIFLNEVLPYAVVNEPRDEWRAMFNGLFAPMVAKARSTNHAIQILNEKIWAIWDVVFKGGQTPFIMSPMQVLSAGLTLEWNPNAPLNVSTYSAFASCTGVSIFLVNACRSVGIPARMTGIAQWVHAYPPPATSPPGAVGQPKKMGSARRSCPGSCMEPDLNAKYQSRRLQTPDPEFANHNWVSVWDNGIWSFTGASEPDKLNHTWFFPDPAEYSIPGSYLNGIWSTSFAPVPAGTHYPMPWDWENDSVPGVDVTEAYINPGGR